MKKRPARKPDQLSPYTEVDRNGAVRVRLGDFLRSDEGQTQLDGIRRVTQRARGRIARDKAAAGS